MTAANRPAGAQLHSTDGGPVHWMTQGLEIPCDRGQHAQSGLSSSVPSEVTCPQCCLLVLAHGLEPGEPYGPSFDPDGPGYETMRYPPQPGAPHAAS